MSKVSAVVYLQSHARTSVLQQLANVRRFAFLHHATIVEIFSESEVVEPNKWPTLRQAIAAAHILKAKLVVAELGRLARNPKFLSELASSGLDFAACDNRRANRLDIHILKSIAEEESRQRSRRTRQGLAAARERGVKPWSDKGRRQSLFVRRRNALNAISVVLPRIRSLRNSGFSYQKIANELNTLGEKTIRGNKWTAMGVRLALRTAEANEGALKTAMVSAGASEAH